MLVPLPRYRSLNPSPRKWNPASARPRPPGWPTHQTARPPPRAPCAPGGLRSASCSRSHTSLLGGGGSRVSWVLRACVCPFWCGKYVAVLSALAMQQQQQQQQLQQHMWQGQEATACHQQYDSSSSSSTAAAAEAGTSEAAAAAAAAAAARQQQRTIVVGGRGDVEGTVHLDGWRPKSRSTWEGTSQNLLSSDFSAFSLRAWQSLPPCCRSCRS